MSQTGVSHVSIKSEFAMKNFGWKLTSRELSDVGRSFILEPQAHILLRYVLFFYMLILLIWSLTASALVGEGQYFFIYLTNWTLLIQTLYMGFALALSVCNLRRNYHTTLELNLYYPDFQTLITWMLQDIVFTGSFIVTVLYWVFLRLGWNNPQVFQVHAANSLVTAIDCFAGAQPPVRLLHLYVPLVYGLVYIIWSLIHYAANIGNPDEGMYIYDILDWSKPLDALALCVGVAVLVPILHMVPYGIRRFGLYFGQNFLCFRNKTVGNNVSDSSSQNRSSNV